MESNKVRAFPTLVPMENKYVGEHYYVRECYPEYYRIVMGLLATKDGVTVTGTPGIGKSVFMAYFFERYSREHPRATITMISYTVKSKVMRVVVARRGKVIQETIYTVTGAMKTVYASVEAAIDTDETIVDSLYLLDGIPSMIPHDRAHWVSFTPPDEGWQKVLRKNSICAQVFMPVWSLDELREAAIELDRTDLLVAIHDDEDSVRELRDNAAAMEKTSRPTLAVINYRFAVFGGVARWCLARCRVNVQSALRWLRADGYTVTAAAYLSVVQSRYSHTPPRALGLLHYVPEGSTRRHSTIQAGSLAAQHFVAKILQATSESDLRKCETAGCHAADMQPIVDLSVAARACRLLRSRDTVNAVKLAGEGVDPLHVVVPRTCDIQRITNRFDVVPFDASNDLLVPFFSEYVDAIDRFAFVIPRDESRCSRVVLFQVTLSLTDAVLARGYSKVLKILGQWAAVERAPHAAAALVFVVPQCNVPEFQAQRITCAPLLDDAGAVAGILSMDSATTDTLARLQIRTVSDLWTFTPRERLPKATWKVVSGVQAKLKQVEAAGSAVDVQASEEVQVMQQIPQYVWGI